VSLAFLKLWQQAFRRAEELFCLCWPGAVEWGSVFFLSLIRGLTTAAVVLGEGFMQPFAAGGACKEGVACAWELVTSMSECGVM
jgi:hypothetical protein